MRTVPLISVLASTLIGIALSAPVEYYSTKYDSLDIEKILNNRRMVTYYSACMLSKGPCPPEGMEFKRILPEALKTNCLRCTEKQKAVVLHSIRRLRKEYPKVWSQFQAQWDPKDIYVKKFEETFDSYDYAPLPVTGDVTNKIDEDHKENNNNVRPATTNVVVVTPSSSRTSTTIRTVISEFPSSTIRHSTALPSSTTQKSTPTTSKNTPKTTNRPIINTTIFNPIRFPPLPLPPVPNFGAGIEATVSFGDNVVGDLVKGIGAIGNRVLETGAEITDVILKNIAKPL